MMRVAVLRFPGSNCDRDAKTALEHVTGGKIPVVWHKDTQLPDGLDLLIIPGGFSYGDYLRCGAIAARSPIIQAVRAFVTSGGYVLGICNGFQILCEIGLLPGTLRRNKALNFVCRLQTLTASNTQSRFTKAVGEHPITIPIAHHDGNFFADTETLDRLEGENRIAFQYAGSNPNGSARDIAGILNEDGRVLGMMPHPERAVGATEGGADGLLIFDGLLH